MLGHTYQVLSNSQPTWKHRLAALLHDIGKVSTMTTSGKDIHFYGHQNVSEKIANRFMIEYKFKNKDRELINLAISTHMSWNEDLSKKTIRKYIDTYSKESVLFCLDLGEADVSERNYKRLGFINEFRTFIENDGFKENEKVKPLINGYELMDSFKLKPCAILGTLIDFQIDKLFENPSITKDEMWKLVNEEFIKMKGSIK